MNIIFIAKTIVAKITPRKIYPTNSTKKKNSADDGSEYVRSKLEEFPE